MSAIEANQEASAPRASSWLFTPATRLDRVAKARASGVDVVIIDLEDSVAPSAKWAARSNVRALLDGESAATLSALAVRINTPRSRAGHDDIGMLLEAGHTPRFIVIPKVESPELVVHVDAVFRDAGKAVALVPLIESVAGLAQVAAIARASKSIAAMMFGAADYGSDSAAQPTSFALEMARVHLAGACAARGLRAIDAPCFALHDAGALQAELSFAVQNGFRGKAAVHPSQVAHINKAFTPTIEKIEWARRVIEAVEQGVAVVDGKMVDEAFIRQAREVLAYRTLKTPAL
jgi:(S)-citramalyl-CoA lyase